MRQHISTHGDQGRRDRARSGTPGAGSFERRAGCSHGRVIRSRPDRWSRARAATERPSRCAARTSPVSWVSGLNGAGALRVGAAMASPGAPPAPARLDLPAVNAPLSDPAPAR